MRYETSDNESGTNTQTACKHSHWTKAGSHIQHTVYLLTLFGGFFQKSNLNLNVPHMAATFPVAAAD